jgi:hypothetical protein
MNYLLENAVAVHGGLDRWNQVKSITVEASIAGALWSLKSKGEALKDVRFEVDTTRELLMMDFVGGAGAQGFAEYLRQQQDRASARKAGTVPSSMILLRRPGPGTAASGPASLMSCTIGKSGGWPWT